MLEWLINLIKTSIFMKKSNIFLEKKSDVSSRYCVSI